MKLATVRTDRGTRAVRVDDDGAVDLGHADVRAVLQRPDWRAEAAAATGEPVALEGLDYAPLVPAPEKIICVGLNYRDHIVEMGRELPAYPTLFAKFARTLVGAHDPITLPAGSDSVDWEAELGVVVGAPVRHATPRQAAAAIAGYTVCNDVSARDFQNRTLQWLQGKMFEASTPVGPWLVTDVEPGRISCAVDGETVQDSHTGELVFSPVDLVAYVSAIVTLVPGDLILTGTPGGVGAGRTPPRFLAAGNEVVTAIEGVGECRNVCMMALPGAVPPPRTP
ncbi:MAG: fumarylacetoacetate hydrolase family protein [Pseudonocardia sp.]